MSEHPTNDPLAGDVTAPQTTPALLAQVASRYGDDPGVVDGDVALTWAQLAGRAAELARAVAAHGIEAGDRVAIWAPNCWEWVVAVLGLHSAGAVLVPINTRYRGEEAAHLLERSQARLLFTVGEFLGTDYLALLGDRRPAVTDTVVVLRSDADTNDLTTGETRRSTLALQRLTATVPRTSSSPPAPPGSRRGRSARTARW